MHFLRNDVPCLSGIKKGKELAKADVGDVAVPFDADVSAAELGGFHGASSPGAQRGDRSRGAAATGPASAGRRRGAPGNLCSLVA